MEIVFIRLGHGEHLLDYPNRLNTTHPGLIEYGKIQVAQLRDKMSFYSDDLILISPTKRTIETALMLSINYRFIITPLVGPRMFPQISESPFLVCDQIYTKAEVINQYREIEVQDLNLDCWGEGINRIEQDLFEEYPK